MNSHLDGFSSDGEVLKGWAYQNQEPMRLWLHSTPALPTLSFYCNSKRPDLAALGAPEHCGFEIEISKLPEAWQKPGLEIRLCRDRDGNLPLIKNKEPILLPPLAHNAESFLKLDQSRYCDEMPSRASKTCQALRHFGGFYRHWYHQQSRMLQRWQSPIGWEPELRALCAGPVLKTPLNPFTKTCPSNWLKELWQNSEMPIPNFAEDKITTAHETGLATTLWESTEPCDPERLLPSWRQHMIDIVLREKPTVSVIIPTWNRQKILLRAIDSALQQTIQALEVLVTDDGSSDDTLRAIQMRFPDAIAKNSLQVIAGDHQGVSSTRNRALSVARGEWIAYLDSDNAWHTDHLLLILYSAIHHPSKPNFLYSGRALYGPRVNGYRLPVQNFDYDNLQSGNYIDLNCLMHHRSIYENLGGFNSHLRRLVDWDLALRYTNPKNGNTILPVAACTVDYWRHPTILENISTKEDWAKAKRQVSELHQLI